MKFFTNKKFSKKIIISLIVMIILNALAPMCSVFADDADDEVGGTLFKPIFQFVATVADLVVRGLQKIFLGNGQIEDSRGGTLSNDEDYSQFYIKYGPAVIFSNKVPGLDANFIHPKYTPSSPYFVSGLKKPDVYRIEQQDYLNKHINEIDSFDDIMDRIRPNLKKDTNKSATITAIADYEYQDEFQIEIEFDNEIIILSDWDGDLFSRAIDRFNYLINGNDDCENQSSVKEFTEDEFSKLMKSEVPGWSGHTGNDWLKDVLDEGADFEWYLKGDKRWFRDYNYEGDNDSEADIFEKIKELGFSVSNAERFDETDSYYYEWKEASGDNTYRCIIDGLGKSTHSWHVEINYGNVNGETKFSTSYELRNTISSWYKGLRALALVGLLSVVVYVGIRIILSSTGQEKAKYKKMITDWLVAICILFILHYIMSFTMLVVEKLIDIFKAKAIGLNDEDVLMSSIRNNINSLDYSSLTTFTNVLIYLVLVIYSVIFTINYLKRLVYLGFFTMIAPLIALTYPLDKIKDGQAQAFTMWIREYVFNALIPVVHLILYYMFVGSALEFVISNPVYAIVCVGFLTQAEKFFRKMFGFDKATTTGQLGAAASGALVMNAINKMGHRSGKQAAGKSSGGDSGSSGGGSTPRYISGQGGGPSGPVGPGKLPKDKNGAPIGASGTAFGQNVEESGGRVRAGIGRKIKGVGAVAGHYINKGNAKKVAKGAGRGIRKGAIGALGAATLGTVGLAAGIATGDATNVLKFGAAGAGAGFMGANAIGDKVTEFEKNNRELYKEGKWGTDEYNTRKSVKELTNDNDFNKLCKQLGVTDQKGREALVRQFHSNGITKSEDIRKALTAGASIPNPNRNEIIAAAKIKQEAQRYGYKKKDIEQELISKGVPANSDELKRAMQLIDLL